MYGRSAFLAGSGIESAYSGLFVGSMVYLFFVWKVFRSSNRESPLKYLVRVVAMTIPTTFLLCWLYPHLYVTWFHLIFIGCFGLITFGVATRVTLAHGSYPLDLELKSTALWCVLIFFGLGIICRVLYSFSDNLWQKSYLHFAASFWILGVLCWCYSFLRKILFQGLRRALRVRKKDETN